MLGLYADDAEYLRVDRSNTPNTPSSPMALRGKEEIGEYLRDVFSRDMTHRIENEMVGEDRAALNLACKYSDGTRKSSRLAARRASSGQGPSKRSGPSLLLLGRLNSQGQCSYTLSL